MPARAFLFFLDTLWLSFTAFGGPQAHLARMLDLWCKKRPFFKEQEILEINALTQLLPGPSSTQTLGALAYKVGGIWFAIACLLVWVLPMAIVLFLLALGFHLGNPTQTWIGIMKFMGPLAIGFVLHGAWLILSKMPRTLPVALAVLVSAAAVIAVPTAYVFPILIVSGAGLWSVTGTIRDEEYRNLHIPLRKVNLWVLGGLLAGFAIAGFAIRSTSGFSLPVRLFENFYRNGLLIFGGGQVLIPYLFTEFVEMKHYLSSEEFLSGLGIQQALPGPVFNFSAFVGAMACRDLSPLSQVLGALGALIGVNLPGILLMFMILPIWTRIRGWEPLRKGLEGILAVSSGFVLGALILMAQSQVWEASSLITTGLTFGVLQLTRIPAPVVVVLALLAGIVY